VGTSARWAPAIDTFAGRMHLEWTPAQAVTQLNHLAFFIDDLKQAWLVEPKIADCPLDDACVKEFKVLDPCL